MAMVMVMAIKMPISNTKTLKSSTLLDEFRQCEISIMASQSYKSQGNDCKIMGNGNDDGFNPNAKKDKKSYENLY